VRALRLAVLAGVLLVLVVVLVRVGVARVLLLLLLLLGVRVRLVRAHKAQPVGHVPGALLEQPPQPCASDGCEHEQARWDESQRPRLHSPLDGHQPDGHAHKQGDLRGTMLFLVVTG